jgi:hypothetical protein
MADNSADRNFRASLNKVAKYAYWILGIILIAGISYFFYNNMQRQITSVLFFIAGVVILYFYYVKWFIVPEKRPDWSPYATPCPDYLTSMPEAGVGADGKYKCFDFVGVSRRPDGIKKTDARMFDQQKNNPMYYFMVDPKEEKESLRQRVQAQGLTWNSLFADN